MNVRTFMRFGAMPLAVLALMLALGSCGGGGGTTTTPGGGQIGNGNNNVPPIDFGDGPVVYPGNQGTPPPTTGGGAEAPAEGPFQFGDNIFKVPIDTNGTARVVANQFSPGQKVAFVVVNMNPRFLDAKANASGEFPALPSAAFSVHADLVSKGSSAVGGAASLVSANRSDLGQTKFYTGMRSTGAITTGRAIYERDARAMGLEPYKAAPVKGTSTIQKGEVRVFQNVDATIAPPVILPGPDNPDKETDGMQYPLCYRSQRGRLVSIGAHCLVFLSTELNNGHPDNVQFTQARLDRLAREFDTVIYPIETVAFGPVLDYRDSSIITGLEDVILTGDDFGNDGDDEDELPDLLLELPCTPDTTIDDEKKIVIFIFNGDAGGFFAFGPAQDEDDRDRFVGNILHIGSDNFPPNDADWDDAFSVMSHEFQHKLYFDHGLPERNTSYSWFNEGLSMLGFHICGYTVNSGKIIPWAIDGQLTGYLNNVNAAAVPMDANPFFSNQDQYGSGFLFFLYMFEHYDPGVGQRIYKAAEKGVPGASGPETDPIKLCEYGARTTDPGPDGVINTAPDDLAPRGDDKIYFDRFDQIYAKFMLANFIDGIYKDNASDLFDPRFHYNTIDLRGTVNLATGTIVLPGVRTQVYPETGTFPVQDNDRLVYPWASDYLVFGNGDGRDLEVSIVADSNFKIFMLPVTFDAATNSVNITPNVKLDY
jgi:hypothetical protein